MAKIAVKNYKGVEIEGIKNAPNAKNAEKRLKDALMEKILEANDFEVPQALVDNEISMMVLEMNHRMNYERLASGTFISMTPEEMEQRLEEISAEAFTMVKTRMLLRGIIEAENLEVTQEELEEEAQAIALRQKTSIEMVKDFLGEDLGSIRNDLLVRKAIDFIYTNAVVK